MRYLPWNLIGRFIALGIILAGCGQAATPSPTESPVATPTITVIPTATPIPELTPERIESIARSTVFIEALITEEGELVTAWSGSGTILSSEGLILTNAHVVMGAEALVISLISRTDQPPLPSFYAEPVEVNNLLDLALIRISADLDGEVVSGDETHLPAILRGDSDALDLGEEIRVMGFPGVGGETVTLTTGVVSGFESEDLGVGALERFWIKTDAEIAPGNSGGTGIDNLGRLIGIPTFVITDETAGRISRLRPVNLVDYLSGEPPARIVEASIYEPNDDFATAFGPLESGSLYSAFIHQQDLDIYFIETETTGAIRIDLTEIPEGTDYDLYLLDEQFRELGWSKSETSSDHIMHLPDDPGTFYIAVLAYQGYSLEQPYVLQVVFDFAQGLPVLPDSEGVLVQGRVVDGNSGRGIKGATVALLQPGLTGEQFIDAGENLELAQAFALTDGNGDFVLSDVPRGQTYTSVIITMNYTYWLDDALTVEEDDPGLLDMGDIVLDTS